MNIKKSSMWMLALVFGVSVILYILDVPIIPQSTQIIPTLTIPTALTPSPLANNVRTFTETVGYDPEGMSETITVTVKVSNGIVSKLFSQHSMNDGKSRKYQQNFEALIQPLVVGKDIRTLNLSRVAGASFTTDAFMQAIKNIQKSI